MSNLTELPLFPLKTVLFPGGPLPLRIFEARYLDMVSRCLKDDAGFGVCLIHEGEETGTAAFHRFGTVARIRDWGNTPEGLLAVIAVGTETCFRIHELRVQPDRLNVGLVELLDPEPSEKLDEMYEPFAELLRDLFDRLPDYYALVERRFDDAAWVSCRLAELLPLNLPQKQYLLELHDPRQRLEILRPLLASLR
ncbi:MAG TPA: LON peptidase substrate-binding domain-containing protein [Gammaproteobacteria bacterium]|nr:LON peptidase substrate-binding domain-containing protein [Gammaproteobacteria bacterium]